MRALLLLLLFFLFGVCSPIKYFIVLEMENRSFDHMLGNLPGVDGINNAKFLNCIPPSSTEFCLSFEKNASDLNDFFDPGHSFEDDVQQIYGQDTVPTNPDVEKMNGFAFNAANTKSELPKDLRERSVMSTWTPKTLPVLNKLASEFCVFDQWFSAGPLPTGNYEFSKIFLSLPIVFLSAVLLFFARNIICYFSPMQIPTELLQ